MSEFKVRLGDMFYVPFLPGSAIVFAADSGYICLNQTVQDRVNSDGNITFFTGVKYLGNILDIFSAAMGGESWSSLPEIDKKSISVWKGTLDN